MTLLRASRRGHRRLLARLRGLAAAALVALVLPGCFFLADSEGGGQAAFDAPRQVDPADVLLLPGYRIEPVVTGLTFPSGVAFDERGRPHVVEAGWSYGEVFTRPRLLRIEPDGRASVVAVGESHGYVPWNGVTHHRGAFYVSAGGQAPGLLQGGRILRITPEDGRIETLLDDLPGRGDHQTNGPAIGPDGWLYFAQGTATNSGVVGVDNWEMGWLKRYPRYNDTPCEDIVLTGENYTSPNPFSRRAEEPFKDDPQTVTTGAFVPFGTPTRPGQTVRGRFPCNGAIMRVRPEGGRAELVAWGFRNPFGLAFSPDGRLFATQNSYDVRGSRPIFGTGDELWEVRRGLWYGWPDFHAGRPLSDANRFAPLRDNPLRRLLARYPNQPPAPAALFAVHASANGLDFSRNPAFGQVGKAFVAQFGDIAPMVGKVLTPVGYRLVTVDVETGVIHDFATNRGPVNGPASWARHRGLERPVDVEFDPSGTALYLVDFGVLTTSSEGMAPRPGTGVLWRITRDPAVAAR